MAALPVMKVLVLGDGGVGKTTIVNRLFAGFEERYIPTIGVQVFPLQLMTSSGPGTVSVWDMAGQERFGGLREGYAIASNCAMIVFDLTAPQSQAVIGRLHQLVLNVCGPIPVVLVGNKRDAETVPSDPPSYASEHNIPYIAISAKSREECFLPLQGLLRLCGHTNITIAGVTRLEGNS